MVSETARCLALNGAELLFYPTAIGSEPILDTDSQGHWQRTMQGHAAANITPVIAANRIGLEEVQPSAENGGQSSSLRFYGSSFLTDETGDILTKADVRKRQSYLPLMIWTRERVSVWIGDSLETVDRICISRL